MKRSVSAACLFVLLAVTPVHAANLAVSIGIRETEAGGGSSGGPVFSDGGTAGGIEFVNRDGQMLVADGTWQLFTFTPATDPLLAFAGTTANSVLEGNWGVLEQIRIRNVDGVTLPIRVWIDNVSHTTSGGTTIEGFERFTVGDEVMFQEPLFSGSTFSNMAPGPNTAAVTDAMAFAGSQSYELNFRFVDDDPDRWLRLTTFSATNVPHPAVLLQEANFDPTISFYAKAIVVPEPSALGMTALAGMMFLLIVRRRTR